MNIKKLTLLTVSLIAATQAFGQGKSSAFQITDSRQVTLSPAAAAATTEGLVVTKNRKGIDLTKTSTFMMHTGPEDDMLSFWINGVRNPTLIMKAGETVHFVFSNTDDDMFHDIRFGGIKPPYSLNPTIAGTVGSHQLAHQSEHSANAEALTLVAPTKPGSYYYFCSVKGHAKGGMFGKVLVK